MSKVVKNKGADFVKFLTQKGYDGIIVNSYNYEKGTVGKTIIAFEPEQIKLITNKKPTTSTDIRYAVSIDNYTEKQYNDYGWVRHNEVVTAREWSDFNAKYSQLKNKQAQFEKTANGEWIIPVNDQTGKSFGVDNVLIYAKGGYQNPKISKIIKIKLDNETDIEIVRSDIYEWEKWDSSLSSEIITRVYGTQIVEICALNDFQSYREIKTDWGKRGGGKQSKGITGNSQIQQNGAGNSAQNSGAQQGVVKRYALSPEAQRAYDESTQRTLTALPNDRITFKDVITKKHTMVGVFFVGAEKKIRTSGPVFPVTRFPRGLKNGRKSLKKRGKR